MRIKDLPQAESVLDSVFLAVDSAADGTKKVTRGHILGDLPGDIADIQADISDIQGDISDLQAADTTLQGNIDAVAAYEPIRIDIASFQTLPQTVTNAAITADMVVLGYWFSRPSSQTGEWTVTTSNGSLTVSGTINGWTALTLILGKANV